MAVIKGFLSIRLKMPLSPKVSGRIAFTRMQAASKMIGATQDITARKLLESKLVQEEITKQKEISTAALKAQQKEREDISEELHDNLNQILVAVKP
jgi:signal transduction histidine kinase